MHAQLSVSGVTASGVAQATVLRVEGDGAVVVRLGAEGEEVICELLHTGGLSTLILGPRDEVLIWQPEARSGRGVVLGRVGTSHAAANVPDELVIEARSGVTIRCGDGSITLRDDGKLLIKGKDLVSHAERTNRIRGGSVAIN